MNFIKIVEMHWEHKLKLKLIEGENYHVLDNYKFVHKATFLNGKFYGTINKIEILNVNWVWQ